MPITLITGTNSGIGMATALHLASRGHHVYATMRDLARSEGLRDAAAARDLPIQITALDVNDESSVQRAVRDVLNREGRIDVLVNNAGIGVLGSIEYTSGAVAKAVFDTNFFGALRVIAAVLPSMRAHRSGTIVNISSVAGRVSAAGVGIYCASKFALEAACEAVAQEVYQFGIRVAIVEPSFTRTPILDKVVDSLPLDDSSPYADAERRVTAMFRQGKQTATDPRLVAEVVEHAIATSDPKLRYPVGAGALAFITGRARITDEEWMALGRQMPDEEYWAEFSAKFPMPAEV